MRGPRTVDADCTPTFPLLREAVFAEISPGTQTLTAEEMQGSNCKMQQRADSLPSFPHGKAQGHLVAADSLGWGWEHACKYTQPLRGAEERWGPPPRRASRGEGGAGKGRGSRRQGEGESPAPATRGRRKEGPCRWDGPEIL